MILGKTKFCIVDGCDQHAILWCGHVIKSRDMVIAGFCKMHKNRSGGYYVNNVQGCQGEYHERMQIIEAKFPNE